MEIVHGGHKTDIDVNRDEDPSRRKFLLAATTVVGGAAAVAAVIPFVASMAPSERAEAAGVPIRFDVARVAPGSLFTVEWRGKPVWVLHRSPEMLAGLGGHDDMLSDPASRIEQQPEYARNATRSIKPPYLITVALCSHLGCVPSYRPDVAHADPGKDWPGGFYCPCHGSKFDLACWVFKNVPAPTKLEIPAHTYLSDTVALIGSDEKS